MISSIENFYQPNQTQTNFKVVAFILLSWLVISSYTYSNNSGIYQRTQLACRLAS